MSEALPTAETLRKLLRYEPENGRLFWKARSPEMFLRLQDCKGWNVKFAGQEAFTTLNDSGYCRGNVLGQDLRAHRVIWAMMTGTWPQGQLDHINGVRADNRWANLREATCSQNLRNRASRPGASSRYLGVSKRQGERKWRANIVICGRQTHLGFFVEEEEAARAYDASARKVHGDFARPNFPETVNA
jgi:hypothetical protein